jgi:ABC-2 type transport system permease protein
MSRRDTRLVMRREFVERGRDRGFLISSGVTLVIVLGAILITSLVAGKDTTPSFTVAFAGPRASAEQTVAVADASNAGMKLTATVADDEAAAEGDVRSGRLNALVGSDSVMVKQSLDPKLGAILQAAHQAVAANTALSAHGIDPGMVAQAARVAPLTTDLLVPADPHAGERKGIAFLTSILLFAQLIGYCMAVAMGVVEEKSTRVVEVLLATVPSRALLAGKIFGIGALGVLQISATVVAGLAMGRATGAIHLSGTAFQAAGLALVWFVLGYAFYASAFAAVASRVSRQEEMQGAIQPLSMLLMVGYFAVFPAIGNPNAGWVKVVSLIPPFSTLLQPVRISGGEVSWWEPVLAVSLMIGLTAVVIAAAARIYENSVLRFGSKVTLKTAWAASKRA